MQQHPTGQQIACCGCTPGAQQAGRKGHRALVREGFCFSTWARRDAERHQARAATLVDHQLVQLQVEVGRAGVVREGQPMQEFDHPTDGIGGLGVGVRSEPFGQRDAEASFDHDEGPMVLHADLGDSRQVGVIETRADRYRLLPALERLGIGRLQPRQAQHHLGAALRVERQPQHRARAFAQQAQQLEAAQGAGRVRRWVCRQVRGKGRNGQGGRSHRQDG